MTVKNGENFLRESIDSVLNQTFTDFEFLIFDDQSSDRTEEIISYYEDSRIRFFKGTDGYVANLNRGIELSAGKYIARMDHDDIMDKSKLSIQYAVMESSGCDLCATWVYLFGEWIGKTTVQELEYSGHIHEPVKSLLNENYIHHSSTMLRRQFLLDNNLFYQHYFPADDYKLWFEMAKRNARFYMIPKPLLSYRLSREQAGHVYENESALKVALIQREIHNYLGSLNKENNQ